MISFFKGQRDVVWLLDLLFGERSLTEVAGVFDNRTSAGAGAEAIQLCQAGGLDASQVRMLHLEDGGHGRSRCWRAGSGSSAVASGPPTFTRT